MLQRWNEYNAKHFSQAKRETEIKSEVRSSMAKMNKIAF